MSVDTHPGCTCEFTPVSLFRHVFSVYASQGAAERRTAHNNGRNGANGMSPNTKETTLDGFDTVP